MVEFNEKGVQRCVRLLLDQTATGGEVVVEVADAKEVEQYVGVEELSAEAEVAKTSNCPQVMAHL